MREVEPLTASRPNEKDEIELVCPSGHRTIHSLKRVLRLNDGWCGKCGADIRYTPLADAEGLAAENLADVARDPDGSVQSS